MGIDYSFNLAVGYRITGEDLEKVFGVETPSTVRSEPRFDPRTGKPTAPELVIDQVGSFKLVYKGHEYDHVSELIDVICSGIMADFSEDGNWMNDVMSFVVGPRLDYLDDTADEGNIYIGGSIPFRCFDGVTAESLRAIGARLRALGLQVGEPVVTIARVIS